MSCASRPRTVRAALLAAGLALLSACAALPRAAAPPAPTAPAGAPGAGPAPVPPAARAAFGQALAALEAGEDDTAEQALLQLTRDFPELSGPHANLGLLYLRQDRPDEAARELERAVTLNPEQAAAWNALGIVHRQRGDFEAAREAYEAALAADPDLAEAHRNLAILLDLYLGRVDEALIHYRRYQALRGDDPQAARWVVEAERRARRRDAGAAAGNSGQ